MMGQRDLANKKQMYQDIFFKNSQFRKDDNDPSLEFVRSSLLGESEVSSLLIYSVGKERGGGSEHTDWSRHKKRASIHHQGIACTRYFDMGLTSAKGKKLGRLKSEANNIFISSTNF
jgi:hypothetical protein